MTTLLAMVLIIVLAALVIAFTVTRIGQSSDRPTNKRKTRDVSCRL